MVKTNLIKLKTKKKRYLKDLKRSDAIMALGKFKDECDLNKCVDPNNTFCNLSLAKCQQIILKNEDEALNYIRKKGYDEEEFIENFRKHSTKGFETQYQQIKINEEVNEAKKRAYSLLTEEQKKQYMVD